MFGYFLYQIQPETQVIIPVELQRKPHGSEAYGQKLVFRQKIYNEWAEVAKAVGLYQVLFDTQLLRQEMVVDGGPLRAGMIAGMAQIGASVLAESPELVIGTLPSPLENDSRFKDYDLRNMVKVARFLAEACIQYPDAVIRLGSFGIADRPIPEIDDSRDAKGTWGGIRRGKWF